MMKQIFCVALLVASGPAFAQSVELNSGHLAMLDADENGAVSADEYKTFFTSAFRLMDTDGNGSLGKTELAPHLNADQISQLDANGDGVVTADEFASKFRADFELADKNGNGSLD